MGILKHIAVVYFTICFHIYAYSVTSSETYHLKPNQHVQTILYYAVQSYGESSEDKTLYAKLLKDYFKYLLLEKVHEQPVSNFEEYLKKHYGGLDLTGVPELDLQQINEQRKPLSIYKSKSTRIQRKIDIDQQLEITEGQQWLFKRIALPNQLFPASLAHGLPANVVSSEINDYFLQELSTQLLQTVHLEIERNLNQIDQASEEVLKQLNTVKGESKNDKILILMVKTLFESYFKELPLQTKKNIVLQMLSEGLSLSTERKLEILIMHSGPQMQKLLQVVAQQEGFPPQIQSLFKKLESQAKKIPFWYLQKLIDKTSFDFEILNLEQKPLGVGTMAQVHRAKIKLKDGQIKNVVIRFLKPGIAERVESDHQILKTLAIEIDANPEFEKIGAPKLSPLVEDITNTVRDELVLKKTILLQMAARESYSSTKIVDINNSKYSLSFEVPEVIPAPEPFLVQSMAFGKKIDKEAAQWTDVMPDLKRSVVENLARLWVEEILYKNGVYHSDLHQGNFLVKVTDPDIRITLLDFGMGGKILPEIQQTLIRLGAALTIKNSNAIAEAIWELIVNKESRSKADFKKFAQKKFKDLQLTSEAYKLDSVAEWLTWTINEGYHLNFHIINLNRGLIILERLLRDSGSSLNITMISKYLGLKYPKKTYDIIFHSSYLPKAELIETGFTLLSKKALTMINSQANVSAKPLTCDQLFH